MPDRAVGGGALHAVLFDMDGLLVDSEPLWQEAESAVMARLGGQWSPGDQQALLGGTLEQTVSLLLGRASRAASRPEVSDWLIDGMAALIAERDLPLQPGAGDLHAEVRAAKIPVALVTSSQPRIVASVLARTGLRFDAVVTGADVRSGKPHPEPYLRAAALLGADPRYCAALEDSATGAASALAAGCAVVAVPAPAAPWSGESVAYLARSLAEVNLALLSAFVPSPESQRSCGSVTNVN